MLDGCGTSSKLAILDTVPETPWNRTHPLQGDVTEHYEKVSQSVEALLDGAEQSHMRASVEHDMTRRSMRL